MLFYEPDRFIQLGGILMRRRNELYLTLTQVAQNLNVSTSVIQAIESGDIKSQEFNSIYYHGILKQYSSLLGLKYPKMAQYISRETATLPLINLANSPKVLNKKSAYSDSHFTKILCIVIFISFTIIFLNSSLKQHYIKNNIVTDFYQT